eukprot:TRINITY_DN3921_c0_g1_i1.p1 TRINITY_DN3921_c0_g1~~TRINITY_DN3921_c0_g1_i1.p1  ORF type:complete len:106 (+),score=14.41 TRINITY_DN3921_c0_g1_i1:83-400(+)
MIRRPPRSTLSSSSAASDVYKRQVVSTQSTGNALFQQWDTMTGYHDRWSGSSWRGCQVSHYMGHRVNRISGQPGNPLNEAIRLSGCVKPITDADSNTSRSRTASA